MQLPNTSNSPILWLDPSEKFVTRDNANRVSSVINRINGIPIIQPIVANQPNWNASAINGTPGLIFSGNQILHQDIVGSYFNNKAPFVVSCVFKATAGDSGNGLWGVGCSANLSSTPAILPVTLGANSFGINYYDNNSNLNFSASITTDSTRFHVFTTMFDGKSMIMRSDGNQIASMIPTLGAINNFSMFAVGGFPEKTDTAFVSGIIGHVVVYLGSAINQDIETFLMGVSGLSTSNGM